MVDIYTQGVLYYDRQQRWDVICSACCIYHSRFTIVFVVTEKILAYYRDPLKTHHSRACESRTFRLQIVRQDEDMKTREKKKPTFYAAQIPYVHVVPSASRFVTVPLSHRGNNVKTGLVYVRMYCMYTVRYNHTCMCKPYCILVLRTTMDIHFRVFYYVFAGVSALYSHRATCVRRRIVRVGRCERISLLVRRTRRQLCIKSPSPPPLTNRTHSYSATGPRENNKRTSSSSSCRHPLEHQRTRAVFFYLRTNTIWYHRETEFSVGLHGNEEKIFYKMLMTTQKCNERKIQNINLKNVQEILIYKIIVFKFNLFI